MPSDGSVPLSTLLAANPFPTGLLIAIIALVIMSGFFSSTETAYSCANRIKLRSLVSNGNKKAEKVLDLAEEKYDKLISSILIGNNIVNLSASTLSTIFFAILITDGNTSALISTVVITVAVLVFGEITPKFIAKVYPEKMAMLYYPLIKLFYYVFFPLNILFSGWKWLLSKIFRFKNEDVVTEDEIMTIVEEAEEDGTIGTEETQLIRSVIEFDDVKYECDCNFVAMMMVNGERKYYTSEYYAYSKEFALCSFTEEGNHASYADKITSFEDFKNAVLK